MYYYQLWFNDVHHRLRSYVNQNFHPMIHPMIHQKSLLMNRCYTKDCCMTVLTECMCLNYCYCMLDNCFLKNFVKKICLEMILLNKSSCKLHYFDLKLQPMKICLLNYHCHKSGLSCMNLHLIGWS